MSILSQCPRSQAAAPPLEDDNLLSEILLRLPPLPSSLPRASFVCRRWRTIASDPGFSRRFSRHHRRNLPPLLGFVTQCFDHIAFQPTMESPNRVPPVRFSMPLDRFGLKLLGCRHGLMLMFDQKLKQFLVWDPVTSKEHSLAVPPGFDTSGALITGAVLCAVEDDHHFRVVLAGSHKQQEHTRVFACIYSSETAQWSDLISTLLPSKDSLCTTGKPAVLAGHSLYWTLTGISSFRILEFDLDRQSLSVIHLPVEFALSRQWDFTVMRAEGGGLGLLFISDLTAQLWKRNTDCDGVASWVLGRTFEVGKLLSLNTDQERRSLMIIGFAECNNVVFMYTVIGLFMVHLGSLKFKKFSKPILMSFHHPFESVYAAGI